MQMVCTGGKFLGPPSPHSPWQGVGLDLWGQLLGLQEVPPREEPALHSLPGGREGSPQCQDNLWELPGRPHRSRTLARTRRGLCSLHTGQAGPPALLLWLKEATSVRAHLGSREGGVEEEGGDCWGGVAGPWWPGLGLRLEGSMASGLF